MSRDMELRCDEAVLAGRTDKTAYSTLLLSFAANRRMTLAPLAFGETGVKQRIKNALRIMLTAYLAERMRQEAEKMLNEVKE